MSILDIVRQIGPVGQMVLLLLLGISMLCWSIIFSKWKILKLATRENSRFLDAFWHGKSIEEIFANVDDYGHSPVAAVFKSGFKELKKLNAPDISADSSDLDNVNRALLRASNAEIANLEKDVSWLASTASAAPFIGLFGTVWGIMDAFHKIGATGSANLAVVAPGISEALIATAVGIGAAIPAVIAYNHFANQIKRLSIDIDSFSQDFLNIVNRNLGARRKGT